MARDLPRVDDRDGGATGTPLGSVTAATTRTSSSPSCTWRSSFHNAAVDWVRAHEPERTGVGEVFAGPAT